MAYHEDVANDKLTETIIGKAIDIHKAIGPGLDEAVYHQLLHEDLLEEGLACESEYEVELTYKGRPVATGRVDLWVEDTVALELKSVGRITDGHVTQLGRYVRAAGATRGLVINFGESVVRTRRYTNFELQDRAEGLDGDTIEKAS